MAIPVIPPRAWALGTLEERNVGGLVFTAWADSVLPYSTPASPPPWWQAGHPGQFQGWQRNMAEGAGAGAPNFPSDRGFNFVTPGMLGLKNSPTAPFRLGTTGDDQWPFTMNDGANSFIDFYLSNFLDEREGMFIIVQLPEREVMNYLGDSGFGVFSPAANGTFFGIETFMRTVMEHPNWPKVRGWYLVDEPDLPSKRIFAPPVGLERLKNKVHLTELNLRRELEPGFIDLPLEEQYARLLPKLLTFSQGVLLFPGLRIYTFYDFADMVGVDFYAYRRDILEIRSAYAGCGKSEDFFSLYTPTDPGLSLQSYRTVRRMFPGKPTFNWIQAHGAPYRSPGATPSSAVEPTPPPAPTCTDTVFARGLDRRMPSTAEARYMTWASIFSGSQGMPCFSQPGIADDLFVARFALIASEINYFAGARLSAVDHRDRVLPGPRDLPIPPVQAGDRRTVLRPQVAFFNYPDPPNMIEMNTWLVIMNHSTTYLVLALNFLDLGDDAGQRFAFQEYEFLAESGDEIGLTPAVPPQIGATGVFVVPPFSMRLYALKSAS